MALHCLVLYHSEFFVASHSLLSFSHALSSLLHYGTSLSVDGEKSRWMTQKILLLEKESLLAFDNILKFSNDKHHAYPDTCAHAILLSGRKEPLLADEIFCQLIKQTTNNRRTEHSLRIWKLLYLCVQVFAPSLFSVTRVLLSHFIKYAHTQPEKWWFCDSTSASSSASTSHLVQRTFDTIPNVATYCMEDYVHLYGLPLRETSKLIAYPSEVPKIEQISLFCKPKGTFVPVPSSPRSEYEEEDEEPTPPSSFVSSASSSSSFSASSSVSSSPGGSPSISVASSRSPSISSPASIPSSSTSSLLETCPFCSARLLRLHEGQKLRFCSSCSKRLPN